MTRLTALTLTLLTLTLSPSLASSDPLTWRRETLPCGAYITRRSGTTAYIRAPSDPLAHHFPILDIQDPLSNPRPSARSPRAHDLINRGLALASRNALCPGEQDVR